MAAAVAVAALLRSIGHVDPLEPEILDYICSVLDDPDPDSSAVDVLISVLGECVSTFGALDSEQQAELVLQLLDDVSALLAT